MKPKGISQLWSSVTMIGSGAVFAVFIAALRGHPWNLPVLGFGIVVTAIGGVGMFRTHPTKTNGN